MNIQESTGDQSSSSILQESEEKPSKWPTVIGVISVIYALGGLLCMAGYAVSTLFTEALMRMGGMTMTVPPVIKLTANPRTARTMSEHIDYDCSGLLQRQKNLDQTGDELIEVMLRTCNGRLTAAEALGHREFVMTRLYESA